MNGGSVQKRGRGEGEGDKIERKGAAAFLQTVI